MASTVDINRSRMTLRDDLVFVPQNYRRKTFYHIEVEEESAFYRVGYAEYVFLSFLDGETSFAEALALTAQKLGPTALTTSRAMTTYLWLVEKNLGSIDDGQVPLGNDSAAGSPGVLQKLNPFWLKVPFGNQDKLISALTPSLGWLFGPTAVFFGVVLIAAAMITIAAHWARFCAASTEIFSPSNWLWMGLAWIVLKVFHELAHGVACKRQGGVVSEVGLVFILFAPMAYVDVTSAWRLSCKWSRIQIAAAGIYAELVIAALATFLWLRMDAGWQSYLLFNLIVMASVSSIAFNANPLMRFDGYFILSDLLEIPNLYEEGSKSVRCQCERWFFGRLVGEPQDLGGLAWFVRLYGWLALVWRVMVCISLTLAASALFRGAGIALAAFGLASWYGPSLVRLARRLQTEYRADRIAFARAITVSVALATALVGLFRYAPAPVAVSAHGVIEYRDVEHVRSHTSGFVDEIFVADGQIVEKDDLLLRLRNVEVANEYRDLLLSIEQSRLRRRIALESREMAAAQVEKRNLQALEEKLSAARQRYESLEIRSPAAGKAVARLLHDLIGTHVSESDVLLSIGREAEKELVVSVRQSDFDAVVNWLGKPVDIRSGYFTTLPGRLVRLEPRASKELSHQSLAASEGGPLAVKSEENTEKHGKACLVHPHFRGVVEFRNRSAENILSGQRSRMTISARSERLGLWIWRQTHEWIDAKVTSMGPSTMY